MGMVVEGKNAASWVDLEDHSQRQGPELLQSQSLASQVQVTLSREQLRMLQESPGSELGKGLRVHGGQRPRSWCLVLPRSRLPLSSYQHPTWALEGEHDSSGHQVSRPCSPKKSFMKKREGTRCL